MNLKKIEDGPEISIILPCRNEEVALDYCLKQIKEVIKKHHLNAEIVVSDSSSDNSPNIARKYGVRLIQHNKEGYGNACLEGFLYAKGKYIFIADADGTYDFNEVPGLISYLKNGYDLVLGNRMGGKIFPEAMPWHHKYFGNPVLSHFLKLFFRKKINDSQTGMRAIKKESLDRLNLQTEGTEFVSEMLIKSFNNNLKIKDVPICYYPRMGESKLRSFKDGWRNLRFMLLYSPLYLFFLLGLVLFSLGFGSMTLFYLINPEIFGIVLYFHPMFLSSLLLIVGYQLMLFALFAKVYSVNHLGEKSAFMVRFFRFFTLEKVILGGGLLILTGLTVVILIFNSWVKSGFTSLNEAPNFILSLTLLVLGTQTIFSAFMISILGIKHR
jgi:glycosyltransferase involved in cell wall biosynthesis